jgi:hypothetical protein
MSVFMGLAGYRVGYTKGFMSSHKHFLALMVVEFYRRLIMPFPDTEKELTKAAMEHPRVGDHFTEMFAFHLFVIEVDDLNITTVETPSFGRSNPCTLPDDGILKRQTRQEFFDRFSYDCIDGFWIWLVGRDFDVAGWGKTLEGC